MKLKFESTYKKWGITAFLVIASSVILFFTIYRIDGLMKGISELTSILTPFTYGLVMAYLLCPLYNWGVRIFEKVKWPKIRGRDKSRTIAKGISTFISLVAMFALITAFLWMVIPQLIESIVSITKTLPDAISASILWLQNKFENMSNLTGALETYFHSGAEKFKTWVEGILVPAYDSILSGISGSVFSIVSVVKNFFIGVIICVFFINSKDVFAAQSKKLSFALFREDRAEKLLRGAAFSNHTFGRFINGKLLDSLIVGIICFIVMSLLGWPYPTLISVIIGVTNIIPFFGPFIGAIPSSLLILMESPITCLYFIIFILILQQVDGNIIGPKILGDSTGLSSFWVMFAIIVGGGLFGFVGMVIGIPIFAVIYTYICYGVNNRLEKKGLSISLNDYEQLYTYKKDDEVNE